MAPAESHNFARMATEISIRKTPGTVLRHQDSIKAVTDANRSAFGFNPLAAYEEAIAKGKLWVAEDSHGDYLGHLMFGGRPPQGLRIFQIYVAEGKRGLERWSGTRRSWKTSLGDSIRPVMASTLILRIMPVSEKWCWS